MKPLLLALTIFLGGTAFLVWRDRGGAVPNIPSLATHREAAKAVVPPPSAPPKSKSTRVVKVKEPVPDSVPVLEQLSQVQPGQVQPNQAEESPAPGAQAHPAAPRAHPPFPAANKIPMGVDTDAITEQYGYPSAWAVAAEDGHITETLVYVRERTGPATVIRVVDGKVAAAYTKAVPASPQGSLIRKFGLDN